MISQGASFGFFNNPIEGDRISFYGTINATRIVFLNGLDYIDFTFTNGDTTTDPLHKVKIGATALDTVNNLKLFFESNGYQSVSFDITYVPSNVDIPILDAYFNTEDVINFIDEITNTNVSIGFFSNQVTESTRLKYFMQYKNIVGEEYRLDVYQKGFAGETQEINGRVVIEKNEVKSHFDPIRGQVLNIEVEASTLNSFEDFYSINEMDFPVRFYRNNAILFDGYLKPDGIFQSFVYDQWRINIQAVDGLGFLNDLAFVNSDGAQFSGKMSALEIIYNCLLRTGVQTPICTCLDVKYYGMIDTDTSDVLKETKLDVSRFIKSDDSTTMSCMEVLMSVLGVLKSCITQHYGRWFIYRPSIFYNNEYPVALEYKVGIDLFGQISFLNRIEIGSHIDNFYPHHCNANQQISVNGAISAYRLNYKYGFIGSLLANGSLTHEAGTKIYDGWAVQTWVESKNTGYLSIDPISTSGISFISAINDVGETYLRRLAIKSDESSLLLTGYTFDVKTRFISYGFPVDIQIAVYLLDEANIQDYTLNADGSWTTLENSIVLRNYDSPPNGTGDLVDQKFERSFSISTNPLPVDGHIFIQMYVPYKAYGSPAVLVDVKSIEIINTFQGNNVVGEFHTVSRTNRVSSITKINADIANGDNDSTVYKGALYQSDGETLTSLWYRDDFAGSESKPILRISAEDELRMYQKPTKVFSGDILGFSYYLSIYRINNIEGKFIPIAWSHDTFSNITKAKLLELYSPEIYDIEYSKTQDFGETIKPTITS